MLKSKGVFRVEVLSADGKVLKDFEINNGVTIEGKNKLLDIMFDGATQITSWYLGLIDNTGFSALDEDDTYASHAGWTELADYDEATRPEWEPDAAASKQITNSTQVTFTINASVTVNGLFVASNSTKSDTAAAGAVLWATASFGSALALVATNQLRITYTTGFSA